MSSTYKRKESRELSKSILQTARSLFAEHGVEAVSMHQIAKTAGVGQGTLYRRYSQKGELCMDLLEDYFARLQEDIQHILSQHQDAPVKERASLVIRTLVIGLLNDNLLLETIYAAIFAGRNCDKELATVIKSRPYKFFLNTLQELLQEAKEDDLTIPEVTPFVNAHLLISTLSPNSLRHLKEEAGFTSEQLADQVVGTIVHPLFNREA